MILSPGETKTVTLTLASRPYSGTDTITFKAMGSETIEKKVIVTVGNPNTYDRTDPELDWQYTSDCTNLIIKDCDGGTWTIEVKAKDTGAGKIQSHKNNIRLFNELNCRFVAANIKSQWHVLP